jgi:TRAP-type mannitol/chloroaromatic compound transport system substrate-binding protein
MITAHFTWQQAAAWYFHDGTEGNKMAEDLFATFGVKRIQRGISETEVEYMANKKIEKIEDVKGLTFRGAGYFPLILQEFGGSGVMLATADVYSALQTGVIDACEVGNAFGNFASGYHEVTRYWGFPGIHKLCETSSYIINMDVWNDTPKDIQTIIRMVCAYSTLRSWAFSHVKSAEILPVLEKDFAIEFINQSPDLQRKWKEVGWRLADEQGAKQPAFKVMWDKMKAYMNILSPYEALQSPDW